LTDNSGVGEPFPVWLNACCGDFATLECGGFRDLSMCISLFLSSCENLQDLCLFTSTAALLAQVAGNAAQQIATQGSNKPIKILALHFYVLHPIPSNLCAELSRRLFLARSHIVECVSIR